MINLRRLIPAAVFLSVATMSLAGCASPAPRAGAPLSSSQSASAATRTLDLRHLDSPEIWDGGTVVVRPPTSAEAALAISDLTRDRLQSLCSTGEVVCGPSEIVPSVALVVATSPGYATIGTNGSTSPQMNNRLAYEVVWAPTPCPHEAHLTGQSQAVTSAQTSVAATCTTVAWIDAKSVQSIYGLVGQDIRSTK